MSAIGVIFCTHNWSSCALVLDELVSLGLASKVKVMTDGEIEQEIRRGYEDETGSLYQCANRLGPRFYLFVHRLSVPGHY